MDPYCTTTLPSGETRPNGWISIHQNGNPTSTDGFPTIGWISIHWMEIPPGVSWISNHLSQNGWMEIQPPWSQSRAWKLQKVLWSHIEIYHYYPLHYRLRGPIGLLNVQKVSKSRRLFITEGTSKTDNFVLFGEDYDPNILHNYFQPGLAKWNWP